MPGPGRDPSQRLVEQACDDIKGFGELQVGRCAVSDHESIHGRAVCIVVSKGDNADTPLKGLGRECGGVLALKADDCVKTAVESSKFEVCPAPEPLNKQGPAVCVLAAGPRNVPRQPAALDVVGKRRLEYAGDRGVQVFAHGLQPAP